MYAITTSNTTSRHKSTCGAQLATIISGSLTACLGAGLAVFSTEERVHRYGYSLIGAGVVSVALGSIKCYLNKTRILGPTKPVTVVNHWIYRLVPRNWASIPSCNPVSYVAWALLGNDDDGVMGEEPTSGQHWLKRWKASRDEEGKLTQLGEISFRRFVYWNLRNPLHNFTFYVIGFAAWQNIPRYQLVVITRQNISGFKKIILDDVFPMGLSSGIYIGLNTLPIVSWRIYISKKVWIESYAGWRTRGQFGLCLRLKRSK